MNWLGLSFVNDKGLEMMREDIEVPGKERLQCFVSGISKDGCRFLFSAQLLGTILISLDTSYLSVSSLKPKKAESPKKTGEG